MSAREVSIRGSVMDECVLERAEGMVDRSRRAIEGNEHANGDAAI